MRKTKSKNESLFSSRSLAFIATWGGSYAVAFMAAVILAQQIRSGPNVSNVIAVTSVFLISALIQVQASERLIKRSMRGWTLFTLLGILITFFTLNLTIPLPSYSGLLTAFSLLLPIPLIQTVWLRRKVSSAWVWPLASFVGSLVFMVPLTRNTSIGLFMLAGLVYGLVQGAAMRYLRLQPEDTEKAKVDAAQDPATIEDRAARLQQTDEAARSTESWNHSEDQSAQRNLQ